MPSEFLSTFSLHLNEGDSANESEYSKLQMTNNNPIKNKTDGHAQDIAGIEGDSDRVTGEAGLQIARIKYLSNYQN